MQRGAATAVGGRPVDPLSEFARAQIDHTAARDRSIHARPQRKPLHRAFLRIDDQQLLDVVGRVERNLLRRLIARGDDLDQQRHRLHIHPHRTRVGTAKNLTLVQLINNQMPDQLANMPAADTEPGDPG